MDTCGAGEEPKKRTLRAFLRAKILDKAGKRADALKMIAEANAWARETNNANYIEQTQLFWDSIKQ